MSWSGPASNIGAAPSKKRSQQFHRAATFENVTMADTIICRADSFGQCLRDFLSVSRVIEIDSEVETENTLEIAELSPFTAAHAGVAWTGKNGDLKREE
jgi:hypothetical protein